jgi:hypothetical protein
MFIQRIRHLEAYVVLQDSRGDMSKAGPRRPPVASSTMQQQQQQPQEEEDFLTIESGIGGRSVYKVSVGFLFMSRSCSYSSRILQDLTFGYCLLLKLFFQFFFCG